MVKKMTDSGDSLGGTGSHAVLEETGTAFDPTSQHLDLSKEEKRRTTALLMAIQAYDKLIIKEADMLREVDALARSDRGPKIEPATIDAMVEAAWKFDQFIAGNVEFTSLEEVPNGETA